MAIPESQLTTWSNQGAVTTSAAVYNSVRTAIESNSSPLNDQLDNIEIYLQGSYSNKTNIFAESDVDIVVQYNHTFKRNITNLPVDQQRAYLNSYSNASYLWQHFKADVLRALELYFGVQRVKCGNKAIKVIFPNSRITADVIPALHYREYTRFNSVGNEHYFDGISFEDSAGNQIINFPKEHRKNSEDKNASHRANQWYKPTVRIFKNARSHLVDLGKISEDSAPSYFVESMVYNVPDNLFGQNYELTVQNSINFLYQHQFNKFICPNHQHLLFGDESVHWDSDNMTHFLKELIVLWNNW
ncbi:MAG: nucleotidyltransferase [Patescibacteria group bacterium]|jgi:hypothetical protein